MADDKIRITWQEVYAPQVDTALQQQAAWAHAQASSSPHLTAPMSPPPPGRAHPWHNALCYLAGFGLFGGLLAWGFGELAWRFEPVELREFAALVDALERLPAAQQRGELTEAQANDARERILNEHRNNHYFALLRDKGLSEAERDFRLQEMIRRDQRKVWLVSVVFYSLCGTLLAVALGVAEPAVARNMRGLIANGSVAALLGLLGGLIVSLFVDKLYVALGGGRLGSGFSLGGQMLARTAGWGVLGLFLSLAPGLVMRNGKRLAVGLAGGLVGGLLGGLLFDPIALATHNGTLSRLVSVVAIGVVAGVGTGLIEEAVKTGWLRVVAGLLAGKQFILYRDPTYVGSSPQCEIYLFKDARVSPRHAAVHRVPGGFDFQDLQSGSGTFVNGQPISRTRLRGGDQIQIGSTTFVFQERNRAGG